MALFTEFSSCRNPDDIKKNGGFLAHTFITKLSAHDWTIKKGIMYSVFPPITKRSLKLKSVLCWCVLFNGDCLRDFSPDENEIENLFNFLSIWFFPH